MSKTDSQREESIEGQIRECTAYAEKNGFTVVKHYIDRAISAKTDNRPQFQQMIKDSERGIFDVIIVWKLDRFARNRYDSARYKTQLKRNGVKLVSATEVISAGPEGIILESVQEGYSGDMLFAVDELIAYVSRFYTLKIGDLLFTGTPSGVGPVAVGQHLQGYIQERKVLDFNVR